jgi:methyltransferase (TIGR00027 family)
MQHDRPSLTALRVAMSRAAHQLFDDPLVLEDPVALQVIGSAREAQVRAARRRFDATLARFLRAFLVARSRVAEGALAASVRRGVGQYVILGAGLDTFAYRSPYRASTLRVFEVDYPTTQAFKRRQLAAAGIAIPEGLTFVPIDFETQSLADRLREARFRSDQQAFFSWLGVSMYLTRAAVMSTLEYIAALPQGSGVVFDYATALPNPSRPSFLRRVLMRRVAAVDEPWKTFFDPPALEAALRTLGFAHTTDLGPDELNTRFFSGRRDQLRVGGLAHVMSACT